MSKVQPEQIEPVEAGKSMVHSSDGVKHRDVSIAFIGYFLYGGLILMTLYSGIEMSYYNSPEEHGMSFFLYVVGLIKWTLGFIALGCCAYESKKILSAVFTVAALITLTLLIQISQLEVHFNSSITDQIECRYDWLPNGRGIPEDSPCMSDGGWKD